MPNLGRSPQIDAVVAAGQRIPAVGQAPDALAERERDHQEVDAGRADGEQAENRRERRAQTAFQAGPPARNRIPARTGISSPGSRSRRRRRRDRPLARAMPGRCSRAGCRGSSPESKKPSARVASRMMNELVFGMTTAIAARTAITTRILVCWLLIGPCSFPSEQPGRLDRQDQRHRRIQREVGNLREQRLAEIVGQVRPAAPRWRRRRGFPFRQ